MFQKLVILAILPQQYDTLIDAYALRVVYGWPTGYFLKSAQTTAAHFVAQHRGAMPDTWAGGGARWCVLHKSKV
jgi:hypothetical protein